MFSAPSISGPLSWLLRAYLSSGPINSTTNNVNLFEFTPYFLCSVSPRLGVFHVINELNFFNHPLSLLPHISKGGLLGVFSHNVKPPLHSCSVTQVKLSCRA